MKNDQERREFIDDDSNWHPDLYQFRGLVAVQTLTYKGHQWQRVSVWRKGIEFDPKTREIIYPNHWVPIMHSKLLPDGSAFDDSLSVTQILKEIKEIDKKGG